MVFFCCFSNISISVLLVFICWSLSWQTQKHQGQRDGLVWAFYHILSWGPVPSWCICPVLYRMLLAWCEHRISWAPGPSQGRNGYEPDFRDCSQPNSLFLSRSVGSWGVKQPPEQESWMIMVSNIRKGKRMLRKIWQCGTTLHHNYWIFSRFAELSNILNDRICVVFWLPGVSYELSLSPYPLEEVKTALK